MNADLSQLFAAVIIVSMAGIIGFNQPSWLRTYTTQVNYQAALAIHALMYALLFLFLAFALMRIGTARIDAIFISVVATIVLRAMPSVARRLRAAANNLAGAPQRGLAFARSLVDAEVDQSEAALAEAGALLLNRGIDLQQGGIEPVQPVHERLARVTLLFVRLRGWEDDRSYRRFLIEARNDFDQLRQRFDQLVLRVARVLGSIERVGEVSVLSSQRQAGTDPRQSDEMDKLLRRLVADMVSDVCEDLARFHHELCLLAARGVLSAKLTHRGRRRALERVGFTTVPAEAPDGYGLLLFEAALFVLSGLWMYGHIVSSGAPTGGIGEGASITLYTFIATASLAFAIVPKRHWGFANSGLPGRTPLAFVLGAGLSALVVAIVLAIVFGAVLNHGLAGAAELLRFHAVYLPIASFLTACTMAWLVQDHRWRHVEAQWRRRVFDALVLGGAWAAGALVAHVLLDATWFTDALRITREPLFASMWRPMGLSLVMGGVIGWFGPTQVRAPRRQLVLTTVPAEVARLATLAQRVWHDSEDPTVGLQRDRIEAALNVSA